MRPLVSCMVAYMATHAGTAQQPFDLDPNFRLYDSDNWYIASVCPLPDGKVLIAGQFDYPFNMGLNGLARLHPSGFWDYTFEPNNLGMGKITPWDAGLFYIASSQTVRRLLPDGTQDPTFIGMNLGPYFSSVQGGDYHVFPDGRVLMSGAHILSDSIRGFEGMYNLVWFSNTGYLDTTRTHRASDGVIYEIEEQPDGKFLCSGVLTEYEGTPVGKIFRVHPDGALDTSFQTDFVWGEARAFKTLADAHILAGGYLRRNGQQDTLCLVRLMPNGDVDPAFHLSTFEASWTTSSAPLVRGIHVLNDGGIVITGFFDHVDGAVRGGISLLDSNGMTSTDAFHGSGCGPFEYMGSINKSIRHFVPAPDGSYYIHGAYHGYDDGTTNDTTQRLVSRLYGLDVGVEEGRPQAGRLTVAPNPASGSAQVTYDEPLVQTELILSDAFGRTVRHQAMIGGTANLELHGVSSGVYHLQLLDRGHYVTRSKLVVQ
ncbi:MAG: T9SS type A sorting domain-containing protein [Flavobacteriales bacterium]|nr:T9SS type A sorting domain-containing protein [Flavobacteriales bacterium]